MFHLKKNQEFGAAGPRGKYANHCAKLIYSPPLPHDNNNYLFQIALTQAAIFYTITIRKQRGSSSILKIVIGNKFLVYVQKLAGSEFVASKPTFVCVSSRTQKFKFISLRI